MLRKLLDLLFWIAISLHFGGLVALGAIAAPAIFDTTKSANLQLPGTAPPLDPTTQAGGEIFGTVLHRFYYLEAAALTAVLLALLGWYFLVRLRGISTWLIALLWLALAGLTAYDAAILTPQVFSVRAQVRATATQHAGAEPAPWPQRAEFDALHQRSESLGHYEVYLLLAIIAVAAFRNPNPKPASTAPAAGLAVNEPQKMIPQ